MFKTTNTTNSSILICLICLINILFTNNIHNNPIIIFNKTNTHMYNITNHKLYNTINTPLTKYSNNTYIKIIKYRSNNIPINSNNKITNKT